MEETTSMIVDLTFSFHPDGPPFDEDILCDLAANMFPSMTKTRDAMKEQILGEILLEEMEVMDNGAKGRIRLRIGILF